MATDIRTGASVGVEPDIPRPMVPMCGFCGADPLPLLPAFTEIGTGQITIFMCGACRATHGVQLTGVTAPKQSPIIVP